MNTSHRFLLNEYHVRIQYNGEEYPTVVHAYEGAKCLHERDKEIIRNTPSANEVKRLILRMDWKRWAQFPNEHLMLKLLREKFKSRLMKRKLVSTGNRPIIMQNKSHRIYWETCACEEHHSRGQNNLGRLLMKVRAELINQGSDEIQSN